MKLQPILFAAYWLLTAALFAVGIHLAFNHTPTDAQMGVVQKIFYLHLPVAITTFFAAMLVFIAGIGYLWQRKTMWDHLALASGKVAVVFCGVVLLTGMTWGRAAWGVWWQWTPRLTFSLVLWLLYVVYLTLRSSIESPQRRATVCAVYGIVAFLDVPLVYLSVRLFPQDMHPASISLDPDMKRTLLFWFLPVIMLAAGLIVSGYRLAARQAALSASSLETRNSKLKTSPPAPGSSIAATRGVA